MKAIVNRAAGAPSVLSYEEVPDPVPAVGELLIAVKAISIEGGDLISRRLMPPGAFPNIIGYQAAGEVIACGSEVTSFAIGDRVATFGTGGSHATLRVVSQRLAWRLPDALPFELGSTVPVTFGTAHEAVCEFGELRAGETVLIQGAAGGVGLAAVQIAKALGATVLGTSSSDGNLERLAGLGLDHGINHTRQTVSQAARAITGGEGVDLVIDMAGGTGFEDLMAATRYRGRLVTVGAASGVFASVSLMALTTNGHTLKGLMFGRDMATDRGRAVVEDYLSKAARGAVTMPIHAIYPLAEAVEAHSAMETEHPFGRILMRPA